MAHRQDISLRQELRQKTRADHDRLDRRVSTLNVADHQGFTLFTQLHLSCFLAMQSRLDENCASVATLNQMVEGLKRDLQVLSMDQSIVSANLSPRIDPLALDYMVAGSRLGTKVLRRIWVTSNDALVQSADAYFGQPIDPALWPDTCESLSKIPTDSSRAKGIVRDVKALFQLFDQVFDALTSKDKAVA